MDGRIVALQSGIFHQQLPRACTQSIERLKGFDMTNKQFRFSLTVLGILLYLISLALPSFRCATKSFLGYEVLIIGFLDPRWFANIGFFVLVYRTAYRPRTSPKIAVWSLVLALCAIFPAVGCTGAGGAPGQSTTLAIGGFLWVAAVFLVCMANQSTESDLPGQTTI
jgi:hypothetical protein